MRDNVIAVRMHPDRPESIVLLTVDLRQEENVWVGTCLELGTSTYAEALEELQEELASAILLQLNEVERLGFMKEYLREHGVTEIPLPLRSQEATQPQESWGLVGAGV